MASLTTKNKKIASMVVIGLFVFLMLFALVPRALAPAPPSGSVLDKIWNKLLAIETKIDAIEAKLDDETKWVSDADLASAKNEILDAIQAIDGGGNGQGLIGETIEGSITVPENGWIGWVNMQKILEYDPPNPKKISLWISMAATYYLDWEDQFIIQVNYHGNCYQTTINTDESYPRARDSDAVYHFHGAQWLHRAWLVLDQLPVAPTDFPVQIWMYRTQAGTNAWGHDCDVFNYQLIIEEV